MKRHWIGVTCAVVAFLLIRSHSHAQQSIAPGALSEDLFVEALEADTIFQDIGAGLMGSMAGNATWFDYDNDGDLDILASGWNDSLYFTKIYQDSGGTFTDINAPLQALGTERGVTWGDYDNDGDVDIAMQGRADHLNNNVFTKIYRNDNGTYVDIGAPLIGVSGGSTVWVDYDNDGLLDLFVCGSLDNGSSWASKLYLNHNGSFVDVATPFAGVWGSSASWGDYDNDGDQDLFLMGYGTQGMTTRLYRNDAGTFVDTFTPLDVVTSGGSQWVDLDSDGDLDLTYNGAPPSGSPTLALTKVYRNDGGGTFVSLTTGLENLCVSAIAWGDYDNDGDLDVAESGSEQFNGTNPTTKIYRNEGGSFVDIGTTIPGVWFGTLAWGDYDNDGRLDLLVTGGRTVVEPVFVTHPFTRIYRNTFSDANTPPSPPPNAAVVVVPNLAQIAWDPANDLETPQEGLTYNLRFGTSSGASDIIDPLATGGGVRRVATIGNTGFNNVRIIKDLPPGTYYWSVQSIDNAFAGSTFISEQSFIVSDTITDARLFMMQASWNLISVARATAVHATTALFPTASSSAFSYGTGGYTAQPTLAEGTGYWLKFPSTQAVPVVGGDRIADTLSLAQGWNMIGSLSEPVAVSSIESNPPGISTSSFFGYDNGYAESPTLQPGKGYWVKMPQAGQLILQAIGLATPKNRIRIERTGELPPPPPASSPAETPLAYRLEQNYPNPFNPSTVIRYALPADVQVRLTVYDVLGREVARLVDEVQSAGFKSIEFEGANLSGGMYTYVLTAGSHRETKKMLLMK